jgi:hypothetical protein
VYCDTVLYHLLTTTIGYCYANPQSNTVPLYRYLNARANRHYYTTNFQEMGNGINGWVLQGKMCHVHDKHVSGTHAWYKFVNKGTYDRLYTKNRAEGINLNNLSGPISKKVLKAVVKTAYIEEGIACYLQSHSTVDKAISCCKCN